MDDVRNRSGDAFLDRVRAFADRRDLRLAVSRLAEIGGFAVCGARLDSGPKTVAWGLSRAARDISPAVAAVEAVEHLVALATTARRPARSPGSTVRE